MSQLTLYALQHAVAEWVVTTFDEATAANVHERGLRLFEEVVELCQTQGMDKAQLHALVDYVYERPIGKLSQEVGGVTVTLAAMVSALKLSLEVCASDELERIHTPEVIERCRRRQTEKREAGMTGTADDEAIRLFIETGHPRRCAARIVWGDGECECGVLNG